MPDLVLINPAASHGIYGPLGDDLVAVEPPLWCRLIAGYIRDKGFSVKIVDAEALKWSPSDTARFAKADNPRLIAICVFGHQPSASTQQMWGANQVAVALREEGLFRSPPTIMVGGHIAALPERTLREEPIDFACNGEGPITIEGLLRGQPLWEIPGLVWKREHTDEIVNNPRAPMIDDLSMLHGNAWDLLPMDRYVAHNWQCFGDLSKRRPYASIYTTLNCPYKCSFCCISAPFGNNRYLRRNPLQVVDEIKMLHRKYGIGTIKIVDEMFILNPGHYLKICEGLIESGLGSKLNIWAYARVDTVRPETLAALKAAGFKWLALGIESGSKHVRDGTEKALKSDDIVGVVRAIQDSGISVIGNYIFGLPDDDMQSMQQTLDLALACNTEFANFYCAMAYPGSRLYENAVSGGAALPSSWRGYSQHNEDCRPLDTQHVDARTVVKFRDEAFQTYFSNPNYQKMIQGKFGDETLAHIQKMLGYRLKRKLLEAVDQSHAA